MGVDLLVHRYIWRDTVVSFLPYRQRIVSVLNLLFIRIWSVQRNHRPVQLRKLTGILNVEVSALVRGMQKIVAVVFWGHLGTAEKIAPLIL